MQHQFHGPRNGSKVLTSLLHKCAWSAPSSYHIRLVVILRRHIFTNSLKADIKVDTMAMYFLPPDYEFFKPCAPTVSVHSPVLPTSSCSSKPSDENVCPSPKIRNSASPWSLSRLFWATQTAESPQPRPNGGMLAGSPPSKAGELLKQAMTTSEKLAWDTMSKSIMKEHEQSGKEKGGSRWDINITWGDPDKALPAGWYWSTNECLVIASTTFALGTMCRTFRWPHAMAGIWVGKYVVDKASGASLDQEAEDEQ